MNYMVEELAISILPVYSDFCHCITVVDTNSLCNLQEWIYVAYDRLKTNDLQLNSADCFFIKELVRLLKLEELKIVHELLYFSEDSKRGLYFAGYGGWYLYIGPIDYGIDRYKLMIFIRYIDPFVVNESRMVLSKCFGQGSLLLSSIFFNLLIPVLCRSEVALVQDGKAAG